MSKRLLLFTLLIAAATGGYAQEAWKGHHQLQPTLVPQQSGTTQLLIAVSPVNPRVVWAAGTGGTYVVTTDGGSTWRSGVVPGAESLQFRDVQGVSDRVAYLMSIGDNTGDFRIYKTEDAGAHWTVQFTNKTTNAFYDCFAFWGRIGASRIATQSMEYFPTSAPAMARRGTRSPAACHLRWQAKLLSSSGTCITTEGWQNAWIATGGSSIARRLATRDGGYTWNAYDTPFVSNPSAGALSVAFRDPWHGIVGGGDLTNDSATQAATSSDGGQKWTLTTKPPIPGSIFCLAYVRGIEHHDDWWHRDDFGHEHDRSVVITTETQPNFSSGAAAWSPDEGQTWIKLPEVSGYWAVAFANPEAGWFVGNNGKILKISF